MSDNVSDVETELRALLEEEHERRSKFFDDLQKLMSKRQKKRREQMTGGQDATLTELAMRLLKVDDDRSSLLQQLEEVDRRQKGTSARPASGGDRDSGLPPTPTVSADLDARRRYGTVDPALSVRTSGDVLTGFPETVASNDDDNDINSTVNAAPGEVQPSNHQHRDPQEHTDESSDSESSSSPTASAPTVVGDTA